MNKLTTHVLDLVHGCPGRGIAIELYRLTSDEVQAEDPDTEWELVASDTTNFDGRCDQPLLEGDAFVKGCYEIVFQAGAYFDSWNDKQAEPKFLDAIVIRFGISDPTQHYHVPLLLSQYGYSTYRGS